MPQSKQTFLYRNDRIPANKLISYFESRISAIPSELRNEARLDFTKEVKKFGKKPVKLNDGKLLRSQIAETKSFRDVNPDLMFVKDLLSLDLCMYIQKMNEQLSDPDTYKVVRFDMVSTLHEDISSLTADWVKKKRISKELGPLFPEEIVSPLGLMVFLKFIKRVYRYVLLFPLSTVLLTNWLELLMIGLGVTQHPPLLESKIVFLWWNC